jgi:hypothetical protein
MHQALSTLEVESFIAEATSTPIGCNLWQLLPVFYDPRSVADTIYDFLSCMVWLSLQLQTSFVRRVAADSVDGAIEKSMFYLRYA